MDEGALPTVDLVVATLGDRPEHLHRLFESLRSQTHGGFRVILVDQSGSDQLERAPSDEPDVLQVVRLRSAPGLSLARNAGLALVDADLVAFPDDDCTYPADLLEQVANRFMSSPSLDVLTGRTADHAARTSPRWGLEPNVVRKGTVWHAGNSASTFARSSIVRRVGGFDEALGLGSGTPWSSGEEIDYLVRALKLGARIEYDPRIVVIHELRPTSELAAVGRREGAGVGYVLGKHHYPARTVARMLARPIGGVLVSLARRDVLRARFHSQTLLGRARGYLAGRRA